MSIVTVLITRSEAGEAIVAALRDWSAAGQLSEFVWVRESAGDMPSASFRVREGRLLGVSLPNLIVSEAPERVRLLALWSDLDGDALSMTRTAGQLADQLRGMNLRTLSLGTVTVTRLGGSDPQRMLMPDGFLNVLISPDDGRGPADPIRPLDVSDSLPTIGRQSAHAVATVAGLLPGLEQAPIDEVAVPHGVRITPARVFTRLVDASEVEEALRTETLSMAAGYPLVVEQGVQATYVENVERATDDLAASLWKAHAHLLMSGRVGYRPEAQTKIGLLATLKLFFGFMWAAIKNAPAAWASGVVHAGKSWAADKTTLVIFGKGSKMSVVVGGVAGVSDMMDAVHDVADLFDDSDSGHQVHHDYSPVWRDLAGGAMALLDGSSRSQAIQAVSIGGQRGVVRSGTDVAPGPDAALEITDTQLRATTHRERILPTDVLRVRQLAEALESVDPASPHAANVAKMQAEAQTWWRGVKRAFTVKVAERLAQEWDGRIAEIRGYEQILRAAQSGASLDAAVEKALTRRAKLIRMVFFLAIILIVATVVVGLVAAMGVAAIGIICAVWVLCWLLGSLTAYLVGTKELFQARYRREEAVSKAQVAERNLRSALKDADRIVDLYQLLQDWGVVLGRFVENPLGRGSVARPRAAVDANGHALGVQFAQAQVDELRVATLARTLRGQVFQPGWLSKAWDAYLESAADDLGTKGVALRADPHSLYQQRAVAEDRELPLWAHHLAAHQPSHSAGSRVWDGVVNGLNTHAAQHVATLVGSLRLGDGTQPAYASFTTALDATDTHPFPNPLFDAKTVVDGLTRPVTRWQRSGSSGLSQFRTIFDQGSALSRDQLGHVGRPPSSGTENGPSSMPQPAPVPVHDDISY